MQETIGGTPADIGMGGYFEGFRVKGLDELKNSLVIMATKDALEVAKKETLRVTSFDVTCVIV